jgi:hypothetical protein
VVIFDPKHNVLMCAEYEVVGTAPAVSFRFVRWKLLEECNGFFALSPQDMIQVRDWYNENYANPYGGEPGQ